MKFAFDSGYLSQRGLELCDTFIIPCSVSRLQRLSEAKLWFAANVLFINGKETQNLT